MPTYQDIYNRHQNALSTGLIPQGTSLEDYSRQGAQATRDPSWLDVAEGGPVKNFIRTKNAQLNNAIEAGPIDDWTESAAGAVGDLFGVNPEVSRSVGKGLPRMAVDFLPMMAGATVGGLIGGVAGAPAGPGGVLAGAGTGGSYGASIGMGLTSGLSALNAYGETGKLSDAGIAAAMPLVGTKLASIGSKAILANAAKPGSMLGRLGFTGGTTVTGDALTAAERTGLAAQGMEAGTIAGSTMDRVILDKTRDRFLSFVGGNAAALGGFAGLDIARQGPQAVFNRDYLFANAASVLPFMVADAPRLLSHQVLSSKLNVPEAQAHYLRATEQQASQVKALFADLTTPEKLVKYREMGLDLADFAHGYEKSVQAIDKRQADTSAAATKFLEQWNTAVQGDPVLKPITPEGPTNIHALLYPKNGVEYPPAVQEVVDNHKRELGLIGSNYETSIRNAVTKPQDFESALIKLQDDLNASELLKKPVGDREVDDYNQAFKGKMSSDGLLLIRDIHRAAENLPADSQAFKDYTRMRGGDTKGISLDKQLELTVAYGMATGQVPRFKEMQKTAREAANQGDTDKEAKEKAIKKEQRRKPIGLDDASHKDIKEVGEFQQKLAQLDPKQSTSDEENIPSSVMAHIRDLSKAGEGSWTKIGLHRFIKKSMKMLSERANGMTLYDRKKFITDRYNAANRGKRRDAVVSKEKVDRLPEEEGVIAKEEEGKDENAELPDAEVSEDNTAISREPLPGDALDAHEEVLARAKEQGHDWDKFFDTLPKAIENKFGDPNFFPGKLGSVNVQNFVEALARVTNNPKLNKTKAALDFINLSAKDKAKMMKAMAGKDEAYRFAATELGLVPTPDSPLVDAYAFAEQLADRQAFATTEERGQYVKEVVDVAKFFNNPEVLHGLSGFTQTNKPGVKFARVHAGGGFDFSMREVKDGKLIREGKPAVGSKDGTLSEQEFRVHGSELGPMQKGEVEFYKQLVPEAFQGDRVHLQKLWDGLGKVGEQVKVVSYGQDKPVNPLKARFDKMIHDWYDPLASDDKVWVNQYQLGYNKNLPEVLSHISEKHRVAAEEYLNLAKQVKELPVDTTPQATSYYNQISPFDTKKFPVQRVDVVLPDNSKPGVFTKKTSNLWEQDNLHENLPNTLGWAMVQVVPHPVTGEKVMFVGELQSRWAQSLRTAEKTMPLGMRKSELLTPDHPLLPIHQNLILKSLIKKAQEQGIGKIAVSDGETAMMTEGHDKFASDLPNEGDWVAVDLGQPSSELEPLQMVKDPSWKYDGPGGLERAKQILDEDYKHQHGHKGFKIIQVTKELLDQAKLPEQYKGMRLAYDTTLPSIMSKLVGEGGKVEDFGAHKNALDERLPADDFRQPRGSPVFRTPSGTPKTNATALTFDITRPSDRVSTLFAKTSGRVYGAASQKLKQIFMNSAEFNKLSPVEKSLFILAHEHAHIADSKSANGEYGPDILALRNDFMKSVSELSPEAKLHTEQVLMETLLPKHVREMDGIRDVMRNTDPEEWGANLHAMFALSAVHGKDVKVGWSMIPTQLRPYLEHIIQSIQRLVAGAKTWIRLSGNEYQTVTQAKQYVDAVRKSFRQYEWDAAQSQRLLETVDPSKRLDQLNYALSSGKSEDLYGRPRFKTEPRAAASDVFTKVIYGLGNFTRQNKSFARAGDAIQGSDNLVSDAVAHVMQVFYGKVDATGKVKVDAPELDRVMSSKPLKDLWNALMVHSQVNERSLLQELPDGSKVFDMESISPQLRGRLMQFKPEAQKAVQTVIAKHEMAIRATQTHTIEAERSAAEAYLAHTIAGQESFGNAKGFESARPLAQQLLEQYKLGNEQGVDQLLAGIPFEEGQAIKQAAQGFADDVAKLTEFYDVRPNYMSLRRFKEFRYRIEKGKESDVIDASSGSELDALLKQKQADGWSRVSSVIRTGDKHVKEAFQVNDALADLIAGQETRFKKWLETTNLSPEIKEELGKQLNYTEQLRREVNAQSMYKPGVKRKLTGDLSRFDTMEQFMAYVPAAMRAAHKKALNAQVNFELRHPDIVGQQTAKDQFLDLFEQSKKTDPQFWKEINRANATWHIGFNLPGHIAESFQPFMAHIHELVAQGSSMPGALKSTIKAQKELFAMYQQWAKEKIWNPNDLIVNLKGEKIEGLAASWFRANKQAPDSADIARLLQEKSHRFQKAPLSELYEVVGKDQQQLNSMVDENRQLSLGELASKPLHAYERTAMGLYSKFTQHNGITALVTAFRQARKNGMSVEDAIQEAERFDLAVNNSGGRLERPAMFDKLGGAGHMVYALSSYVRGRFAQLATYYKHGWSEQFANGQGGLTPTERANAKKAFQSMILAQVGAAGILGLPFVGAGIALMEQLLGDDVKGKMLTSLDEALGDPILTRIASHGMASAIAESTGLPADLHSRFALSSFLGVNSYDGVSAQSFLGPIAAMANSLWKMGGSVARGEGMTKALSVGGPGGVKRLAEALTPEYQEQNPESSLASSLLGFRSGQQVREKEFNAIRKNQELGFDNAKKLAAQRIHEAMTQNPTASRETLMAEAVKLLPEGMKNPLERQEALKGIVSGLVSRVSSMAMDQVAPPSYRANISAPMAPQADAVAQSLGISNQQPMELARALAGGQARGLLGQQPSKQFFQNAAKRDRTWDPFNSGGSLFGE